MKSKKTLIKIAIMMIFALLISIFAGIAWFTMNKEVETGGMSIKTAPLPFELKTSGSAGLYDDYIDGVESGYYNAETTEGVQGIRWRLTRNTAELENVYTGEGTPDMDEITRRDSDKYGLKPGDSGSLQFSILPRTDGTLDIYMVLNMVGYAATYGTDGYETEDPLTLVDDVTLNRFMKSHIYFFYVGTDSKKHILTEDGFSMSVSGETAVTLYWAWPATLKEILEANITGLNDTDASKEVRRLFFEHPEYFLKTLGDETFESITVANQQNTVAQEAAVEAMISSSGINGRNYNTYGAMYNDADQSIGDHINYLFVSLWADLL